MAIHFPRTGHHKNMPWLPCLLLIQMDWSPGVVQRVVSCFTQKMDGNVIMLLTPGKEIPPLKLLLMAEIMQQIIIGSLPHDLRWLLHLRGWFFSPHRNARRYSYLTVDRRITPFTVGGQGTWDLWFVTRWNESPPICKTGSLKIIWKQQFGPIEYPKSDCIGGVSFADTWPCEPRKMSETESVAQTRKNYTVNKSGNMQTSRFWIDALSSKNDCSSAAA